MHKYGRKIFYDLESGVILHDSGEMETTVPDYAPNYFAFVTKLQERDPKTVGRLDLEYGAYAEDFAAGGILDRVDLETQEPMFIYPDPNDPEEPPTPQLSLSERLQRAEQQNAETKLAVEDLVTTMTELMMGGE